MATSLTIETLSDLLEVARKVADFPEFEKILVEEDYPTINQWYQNDRRRKSSGVTIRQVVSLGDNGAAEWVGLFEQRDLVVSDQPDQVTANWRILRSHYAFDRYEDLWNNGEEDLADVVKMRRQDAMLGMADELEDSAWKAPQNANDNKSLWGVPYWINLGPAGTYEDGFNENQVIRYTDSSTGTNRGGIDSSTESKWRNYTGIWDGKVGKPTMQKLRKAMRKTKFRPPVVMPSTGTGQMPSRRLYCDGDTMDNIEAYLDSRGGSDSNEMVRVNGMPHFKRAPFVYVPKLDDASYSPIYGINHNDFFPFVQSGEYFREEDPRRMESRPTTLVIDMFTATQLFCKRLNTNFVLHTEIPE